MTDQDSAAFARLMTLLSQNYEKAVSGALAEIYFDGLKEFPIEDVDRAVKQAVKTKTFFPKVAELREIIAGTPDDRAAQAWAAFLEAAADGGQASIKFADPATARAMDAVFGGWIQACRLLSAGGTDTRGKQTGGCTDEMLASYQKHFTRQYIAALNSQRDVELYRPGSSEMSLREGGGAWAARMPTLKQPVIYIGAGKTLTVRLEFDVAQGQLTQSARAALESGWESVLRLHVASQVGQLMAADRKALPPAGEEMATPEEVEQIAGAIKAIAERRRPDNVINITEGRK